MGNETGLNLGTCRPYNNRPGALGLMRMLPARLRKGHGSPEPSHFVLEVNGRRIAYCYIRKNGCTAFKRLILHCSPYAMEANPAENPLYFISRYHLVTSVTDLEGCDERIFVYRCPLERAASLYINKFVAQNGNTDIFRNFQALTGLDPKSTTFRDFVNCYLSKHPWGALDVHAHPQVLHLKPIRYSAAIPIAHLAECMKRIIGAELADRFFANPVNASNSAGFQGGDYSEIPAKELHAVYLHNGQLPRAKNLLAPNPAYRLMSIYAADMSLVRQLGGATLVDGEKSQAQRGIT